MNRAIIPVLGVTFLHQAAQFASRPLIPLLAADLGIGIFEIGLIAASFNIVQVLLALWAGRVIDQFGPRKPAIAGSVLLVVALAGLPFGQHWLTFCLIQAVAGISHLVVQIGYQLLVTSLGEPSDRQNNVGHMAFMVAAGMSFGPVMGGFAIELLGTKNGLWVSCLLAVASWIMSLYIPDQPIRPRLKEESGSSWQLVRDPTMLRVLYIGVAVLFATDVLVTYFPLYAREAGLSVGMVGMALSVRGFASMLVRPMMGKILQWFGRRRVVLGSLIIGGLSIIAYGLTAHSYAVIGVSAVAGLAIGLSIPLTLLLTADGVPPHLLGRALALRLMGNRLSQSVSPILFGLLAASFGLAPVFFISGGVLALSAVGLRRETPVP